MQNLGPLNAYQAALAPELREEYIRAVSLHDLADFVQPIKEYGVNLAGRHNYILYVAFRIHDQLMKLLLCLVDILLRVPSDVDLIFSSSMSARWGVSIDTGKWWWEVNGCIGNGLNKSDVLPCSTADDRVQGELQLHHIHSTFELYQALLADSSSDLAGGDRLSDRS